MSNVCAAYGIGFRAKRPLQACTVMAFLFYPVRAFLPPSSSALRQQRYTILQMTAAAAAAVRRYSTRQRPAPLSLSAADRAKEAAVEAIRAAENGLNRVAPEAGEAMDGTGNVQATVAAARAAARSALESLQRGEGNLTATGGEGSVRVTEDTLKSMEEVTSQARVALKAALAAVADADTDPPPPSFTVASDAISAAQSALEHRDSATAELNAAAAADVAGRAEQVGDGGVVTAAVTASEGPVATLERGMEADGVDVCEEEELTKEPDSARVTRSSPAASHSHLSHLIWRQVAGPGDTVLDCTAGNGHDSLELAKIVALKDGMGRLYAMDVQDRALEATRERLESELGEMAAKRSVLVKGNFRSLSDDLGNASVQLIVYNLGWLPGGDKSITTMLEDTLESIEAAKRLVKSGGVISVMLYQGHAEGKRETEAVLEYATGLSHFQWRVFVHDRINRPGSPVLLTLYKL